VKDRLFFHVCCAPCATYPIEQLKDKFDVTLLFCGPNIYPEEEYKKRLDACCDLSKRVGLPLVEIPPNVEEWQHAVGGLEKEPEGGKRCSICYMVRLENTARFAKENTCKYFGTTLTVSPHKPVDIINPIGENIAEKYGLIFITEDFKKNDGFKRGCILSKEYGLYRQNYCGCKYSIRKV